MISNIPMSSSTTSLRAIDPVNVFGGIPNGAPVHASSIFDSSLSNDPSIYATSTLISETEAWVAPVAAVLDPTLNLLSFAMLCRVVISWYPSTNVNEFPFNIVTWPTEPLLKTIRGVIPPAFGVDITPIVWLGLFTFLHEILLGQQGLFTMKIKYGI
eukprot:CAMPEP_0195528190 /NCGR_PEP_ID=MMETSP0794_2-20130614/30236_1 /TAXON_ID=515487 /ORGANISM="Stephanopyxis turris, Strain CCMP 815" /LENGTH=156 /DNA_ID=CAMNT_0040659277 /DNA_START=181 /DNA_END=651 /DNA_ORIENTATION=+